MNPKQGQDQPGRRQDQREDEQRDIKPDETFPEAGEGQENEQDQQDQRQRQRDTGVSDSSRNEPDRSRQGDQSRG